jgi:hypothetical protein
MQSSVRFAKAPLTRRKNQPKSRSKIMFGLVLANRSLVVFELPQEGQGFPAALAGEAKAVSDSLLGVSYGFIFLPIKECAQVELRS